MKLFDTTIEKCDSSYKSIRDESGLETQKQYFETLWEKYKNYADPDFIKKFPNEEFHQRFWEMYLTCTLKEYGHSPIPKSKSNGPDICLKYGNLNIWIEAVAPTQGIGEDMVPYLTTDSFDLVPEEKIVLRYTAAILEKWKKLKGYKDDKGEYHLGYIDKGIIKSTDPFIIAVNGGAIPFAECEDEYVPYIMRAVLPYADPKVIFDTKSNEIIGKVISYRPMILKKNKSPIYTLSFADKKFSNITGIIFSNANSLGAHEKKGREFIYIRNQNARNKLPHCWLEFGAEFYLEEGHKYINRTRID